MMRKSFVSLVIALQLLSACSAARKAPSNDELQKFVAGKPAALQPYFSRLYVEGENNAVLNFQRLGLAAMEQGEYPVAEEAFDEAIARINTVYADDENAKRAKSLWSAEKVKDFKGEPYERAMAFYYRGLLYLRASDYENARASFLQAQFQDTQSEKEEFAGDFALMDLLAGFSSRCADDATRDAELTKAAVSRDPSLAPLAEADHRSLAIVETGSGPRKQAEGKHGEKMVVVDAGSSVAPDVRGGGEDVGSPVHAADVYYQASTRGGRPVQAILDGKAEFKDTTDTVGDAALATANVATQMANYGGSLAGSYVGLGMLAVGIVSKIASAATAPDADVRYWETLPRDVYAVSSAKALPSDLSASAAGSEAALTMRAESPTCSIAWGRVGTSGASAGTQTAAAGSSARDEAFRQGLSTIF
jgi:tetratricopeptide (TPR) repeat protein